MHLQSREMKEQPVAYGFDYHMRGHDKDNYM